jgi:uncharacterized membrane protein YhhN
MKTKVLTFLYFLTGILFIFLQYQPYFLPGLIAKALIIPLLMLLLALNISPVNDRSQRLMLAALFFSWAGDMILELSHLNNSLFTFGLLSFLLAHVMYIFVFIGTPGKKGFLVKHVYLLVPVILYGVGLVLYLYNDLAGMRLPVIIYAAVILTMLTASFDRIEKVNRASYWLVLSGAILFVISDSAIAVNKFSFHFAGSGIIIMSTYIIAQYLIVTGYIRQFRNDQNPE